MREMPFFTTKEPRKGTGIGLSIVHRIIEQHNGFINVYSEPGKGTTFKICLPISESEAKETETISLITPPRGRETVLVAENNVEVREFIIKQVLEKFGYKVIEAVDGEDAVNKFMANKDRIQLLILDVVIPKKNGREACPSYRKSF